MEGKNMKMLEENLATRPATLSFRALVDTEISIQGNDNTRTQTIQIKWNLVAILENGIRYSKSLGETYISGSGFNVEGIKSNPGDFFADLQDLNFDETHIVCGMLPLDAKELAEEILSETVRGFTPEERFRDWEKVDSPVSVGD